MHHRTVVCSPISRGWPLNGKQSFRGQRCWRRRLDHDNKSQNSRLYGWTWTCKYGLRRLLPRSSRRFSALRNHRWENGDRWRRGYSLCDSSYHDNKHELKSSRQILSILINCYQLSFSYSEYHADASEISAKKKTIVKFVRYIYINIGGRRPSSLDGNTIGR